MAEARVCASEVHVEAPLLLPELDSQWSLVGRGTASEGSSSMALAAGRQVRRISTGVAVLVVIGLAAARHSGHSFIRSSAHSKIRSLVADSHRLVVKASIDAQDPFHGVLNRVSSPSPLFVPGPTPAPPGFAGPYRPPVLNVGCQTGKPVRLYSHHHQLLTVGTGDGFYFGSQLVRESEFSLLNASVDEDTGEQLVYIVAHNGEYIADATDDVRLSLDKGRWARFHVSDAGGGQVYIRSRDQRFLQDREGKFALTWHTDGWEKWWIHTLDGNEACGFEWTKLYCFAVMKSDSMDQILIETQYKLNSGIFQCDNTQVMSDAVIVFSRDAIQYPTTKIDLTFPGGGSSSLHKDRDLFFAVWEEVKAHYDANDWVVKVDPDTVFVPFRLRQRLGGHSNAHTHPQFYATCEAWDDIQRKDRNEYMYGALQVFSHAAVKTFFKYASECNGSVSIEEGGWREERFITRCLESTGIAINPYRNWNHYLLNDPHCVPDLQEPDCTTKAVAFHPLGTPAKWQRCHDLIFNGNNPSDMNRVP